MVLLGPAPDQPAGIRTKHRNGNATFPAARAKSPGLRPDPALVCQRRPPSLPPLCRPATTEPGPGDRRRDFLPHPVSCSLSQGRQPCVTPATVRRSSHSPYPGPSTRPGAPRFSSLVPLLARSRHGGLLAGPRHTRRLPPEGLRPDTATELSATRDGATSSRGPARLTYCSTQLMFGECLQKRYRETCSVGWYLYSFRMLRALSEEAFAGQARECRAHGCQGVPSGCGGGHVAVRTRAPTP